MRKLLNIIGLVTLMLTNSGIATVKAELSPAITGDDYSGEVICLPGVYLTEPDSCLAAGPSSVLTQMAKEGVIYPAPSLPVTKPSISLNVIPYKYAKITSPSAPLYGSPEMADARTPTFQLAGATRYISYSILSTDGCRFLLSVRLRYVGGRWRRGQSSPTHVSGCSGA